MGHSLLKVQGKHHSAADYILSGLVRSNDVAQLCDIKTGSKFDLKSGRGLDLSNNDLTKHFDTPTYVYAAYFIDLSTGQLIQTLIDATVTEVSLTHVNPINSIILSKAPLFEDEGVAEVLNNTVTIVDSDGNTIVLQGA